MSHQEIKKGSLHDVAGQEASSDAKSFSKAFEAGWEHIDLNGHVRGSVYSEWATNTRASFLIENQVGPEHCYARNLGPLVIREFSEYRSEVRLAHKVEVSMIWYGISKRLHTVLFLQDIFNSTTQKLAASVCVEVGWLEIQKRRLASVSNIDWPEFNDMMRSLQKSPDFIHGYNPKDFRLAFFRSRK